MDFTVLKYFQAVARNGNMTKTARELYITQPNLCKSNVHAGKKHAAIIIEHDFAFSVFKQRHTDFFLQLRNTFAEIWLRNI